MRVRTAHGNSFDHLVGAGEQHLWHLKAERFGGLEVDHQLEPRRLYHGQICGLRAVEKEPANMQAYAEHIRELIL
jgi:hypothetical protein